MGAGTTDHWPLRWDLAIGEWDWGQLRSELQTYQEKGLERGKTKQSKEHNRMILII